MFLVLFPHALVDHSILLIHPNQHLLQVTQRPIDAPGLNFQGQVYQAFVLPHPQPVAFNNAHNNCAPCSDVGMLFFRPSLEIHSFHLNRIEDTVAHDLFLLAEEDADGLGHDIPRSNLEDFVRIEGFACVPLVAVDGELALAVPVAIPHLPDVAAHLLLTGSVQTRLVVGTVVLGAVNIVSGAHLDVLGVEAAQMGLHGELDARGPWGISSLRF
mmetsp:Transcript_160225/g.509960  ORF Transcript_160225/g.509960 Transcript_160225/m.509960 type:complete len:214 (-) Transcript_160225:196-837(-)